MDQIKVVVKIQNLDSATKKEEKVEITLPTNKEINIKERIIEQLINKKKWEVMADQLVQVSIRTEKSNEPERVAPSHMTVQAGDKFFVKKCKVGSKKSLDIASTLMYGASACGCR